ncbi:protein kinase [Hamiltosporidium magnivora]|uniref:non-specific serine/threonine protein kinase n=1 Tax=Hamiltosporidium magnivora TaxID=148818 RepID=A0A4Q9LBE0_9MICR|nr:protein kinase [Hamiltosporidium magnivora]
MQVCFAIPISDLDFIDLNSEYFTIGNGSKQNTYIMEKKINSGTYGTVFLSHKKANKEKVAVKVQRTFIYDYFGVTRDVLFTSILKHENIVEIHCFDIFGPNEYSVYEYIPNTFYDLLSTNTVDFSEFLFLIKQILDALNYLRTKNIIYFDLKDNNIMVKENFQVKLIDFGMSTFKESQFNIFNELTKKEGKLSDFDHLLYSPEVKAGKNFDHKADIWSLGILFMKYFKMYEKNLPDDLYFMAKSFYEKCTSEDKKSRFSADQALMHPIFNDLFHFVFCFASLDDFFYTKESISLVKRGKTIYFRNTNFCFEIHCCCVNSNRFHNFISSITQIINICCFGSKKLNHKNLAKFTVILNSQKIPLQHLTFSYYQQLICIFEILNKK